MNIQLRWVFDWRILPPKNTYNFKPEDLGYKKNNNKLVTMDYYISDVKYWSAFWQDYSLFIQFFMFLFKVPYG